MIRWKLLSAIAVVAALASFAALGGGLRWSSRTVPVQDTGGVSTEGLRWN